MVMQRVLVSLDTPAAHLTVGPSVSLAPSVLRLEPVSTRSARIPVPALAGYMPGVRWSTTTRYAAVHQRWLGIRLSDAWKIVSTTLLAEIVELNYFIVLL